MPIHKSIFHLAIFCLLLAPLPATAKPDLCNELLPPELAVGDYKLTAHNGTMSMMGRTMPWRGGGSTGWAKIVLSEDTLIMTSDSDFRVVFDMQKADPGDWWGESQGFIKDTELASIDISLCPTARSLPRLLANGSGHYFEGGPADVKLGLSVYEITPKGVFASGLIHITGKSDGVKVAIDFPFDIEPK